MLRITQQDSAKGAKSYYASADYYSEGQELIGSWGGKAAELMGLKGVVDKFSFDRLCDNIHPVTGMKLTVRNKSQRTVGYDFTFSVPKSVSLLYATTSDQTILEAFRSAVDETMADIESEMKTRVRKGGKYEERTTGNLAWAEFIHKTSRPVDGIPDPQLHAHVFCFNSTWDQEEKRWKAGQFRDLKRDAPYFQAAFRVRLANKLQDLGYGVERKRDDFEIAEMPLSAVRKFSRRTEEIESLAAERGITDPKKKDKLGAETREKKSKELSWDQLCKEWDTRLTDPERQAITDVFKREAPYARQIEGEAQAVDYAVEHCFVRESVVSDRKLQTEAMKRGVGSVTIEGVKRELASRPLLWGEGVDRHLATSPQMLGAESRIIAFARKGRGRLRPLVSGDRPISRDWFNAGQKKAVLHVLNSRDRVTIVRGVSGTGKTTLEQEIGEALASVNVPVVALAPTSGATRVLKVEAGFAEASTLAGFFKSEEMQDKVRGGVILVDEASMIGTKDMGQLFDLAKEKQARVVLVGDKRQHRAVSAGEPLKLLEDRAGLRVAEVSEILRQKGDYKKAAEALSQGRTEDGFAELDKLGWIKEIGNDERYLVMADAYLAATNQRKKGDELKTALIVTPTHAEAAKITETLRAKLKEAKKLGEERQFKVWVPTHLTAPEKSDRTQIEPGMMLQFHQNTPGHKIGSRLIVGEGDSLPIQHPDRFEVYRPSGLTFAVGDRIRITRNGKTKDKKHDLDNGALYTVKGFTQQGDIVTDNHWIIGKDFGHVAHGFAVTSMASQGRTVDKVFIGLASDSLPATNQRSFYVPVTRGRESAVIYTDNKKELLRAAQRPDQPMSATELVHKSHRRQTLRKRLKLHLATLYKAVTFARTHNSLSHQQKENSRGR